MPWRTRTVVSERDEFVRRRLSLRTSMTALCREFGISRNAGYELMRRYAEGESNGLADRSSRPNTSPRQTAAELEARVCELRIKYRFWGGRKLHRMLKNEGIDTPPAPSTITDILRRNGLLLPERRLKRDWQRFEAAQPNDLWQMDFKGHFPIANGRCHPLTVTDDHSRFNLCLGACGDETAETVRAQLERVFETFGLPDVMLMDNGSPWGSAQAHPHTQLTAHLIRLGITVKHGRPYHPQTQGKEERFHRTLKLELLSWHAGWPDLAAVQASFDAYREIYNQVRPHQSLGYDVPADHYRASHRTLAEARRPFEYESQDEKRKVQEKGRISFRGRQFLISRAFVGETVALRASGDGVWEVYYRHQRLNSIDLRTPPSGPEL